MSKEHNKLGQWIIHDVETGEIVKFNKEEYDQFLTQLWVKSAIKPDYNKKTFFDEE